MNKLQNTSYSLFFILVMGAVLLLTACGTGADSVSAATIDPVTNSDLVEAVESDAVQEELPAAAVEDTTQIVEPAAPRQAAPATTNGNGNGNGQGTPIQSGEHITPSGELTESEAEGLLFMREEEKLARDVYLTLYEAWGTPVFTNIASSEQAHMDAIAYLLQSYGLQDPAAGKDVGEFSNQDLQTLYDQLVTQGQGSLVDALLVGGAIEEIDIIDLQEYLAQTDNASIIQVYENLLRGSINHLNAFVTNYERQTGSSYVPQYLSQDALNALVDSTSGQGNGPGSGSGGGNGGQGSGNGGQGSGNGGGQGNGNGRGRSG